MNPKGIKRFKKLKAIFKSLKGGTSISQACKAASVDVSTLWEWRRANERLDEKIHRIIESRIQMVEDALFKSAVDGNVTAQLAFLFNRDPKRWADKRALVNNTIINQNKLSLKEGFSDEDKQFAEEIRRQMFPELPQK